MSYASTKKRAKTPKYKLEERPTFYWYMFKFFRFMDWRFAAAWMNRKALPTHDVYVNGRHAGVKCVNDHARKVRLVEGKAA
jgi:hypothetical protein